jgi:lysophosphatidate acyltransferase
MKEGLKFLPFIGFYLGQHGCVYVKRGVEKEINSNSKTSKVRQNLCKIKDWRSKYDIPTWLVVYPEGTRFEPKSPAKIKKSEDFAKESKLTPLKVSSPDAGDFPCYSLTVT